LRIYEQDDFNAIRRIILLEPRFMKDNNTLKFEIKIGTSGYSYDDWRNHFYPPEIPKTQMLNFYCQYFKTVEVNSSYYRIPTANIIERMAQKTPDDFEFIVKVNRETTHRRMENEQAINQLLDALKPMNRDFINQVSMACASRP